MFRLGFSPYQTLLIVMVALSENHRAFVFLSSIVCREAAFDFKSGTIGKLSVMTIANLVGGWCGKIVRVAQTTGAG